MSRVDLSGRNAVVTGGGRGVGRAIAEALAGAGATVVVVSRSEAELEEVAEKISASGGTAHVIPGDVTDPAFVARLTEETHAKAGPVSIAVSSAGVIGPIASIEDSDPAEWLRTFMVNTYGTYLISRAFVGDMRRQGWGRVVNVTSAASLHPPSPLISSYATSKVAVNQLTRHLAAELEGTGVTANVLHPGDVRTEMWADIRDQARGLGPEGEAWRAWVQWVDETGGDPPEKAAAAVLALAAEDNAANGRFLWIEDGLQAPIPSWEDPDDDRPWLR